MPGYGEKYGDLIGKHVDEVIQKLKNDGLQVRIYEHLGLVRSENPNLVQVQVDSNTKLVRTIS